MKKVTKNTAEAVHQIMPTLVPYSQDYLDQVSSTWKIPIGVNPNGETVIHDFEVTPSLLISGNTQTGKTTTIKSILTSLALSNNEKAEFYLIDLDGGLSFSSLKSIPQTKKLATSLEETAELLTELKEKMTNRLKMFSREKIENIADTDIRDRQYIVVNELCCLFAYQPSKEEKDLYNYCISTLCDFFRMSGALGFRLIVGVQSPTTQTLPSLMKANTTAFLTFRLHSDMSRRVIGTEEAAYLPSNIRGRGFYSRIENEIEQLVQTFYVTNEQVRRYLGGH